mgnify:CR=1 FL=1
MFKHLTPLFAFFAVLAVPCVLGFEFKTFSEPVMEDLYSLHGGTQTKLNVSVKATTEEGLGFTGDGTAMACQAVSTVEHR